jgi:two-component system phosphate regulon sensor histidine kinase PhoR
VSQLAQTILIPLGLGALASSALLSLGAGILFAGTIGAVVAAGSAFSTRRHSQALLQSFISELLPALGNKEDLRLPKFASLPFRDRVRMRRALKAIGKERRNLEEDLSALKGVLRGMREGVITLDADRCARKWNRAAEEIIGLKEQWRGRPIDELVRSTAFEQLIETTFKERKFTQAEITLQGFSRRVLEVDAIPLQSERKEDQRVLLVLHDLSRVKRLEQVRTEFVANVSHELRTPITSIRGFSETLLSGALQSPSDSKRFVEIIFRQSKRLESIIDELLLLSSIEGNPAASLHFETISIRDVIQTTRDLVEHRLVERSIRLNIEGDVELLIEARVPLLEQAILNLLQNAITFSPSGSSITIRVEHINQAVRISIVDQGPGIEEAHHGRLFERFYRVDKARSRKDGGTGLGLAIVKHIAQVHGGGVGLQSSLGSGSTFFIDLPIQRKILEN